MGMRGCDEHHKLKFGDFTSKETSDGKAYIEFNETDTKTRSGATKESRAFKPRMWSNPLHPERCPVRIFHCFLKQFVSKTNLAFDVLELSWQPFSVG